MAHLDFHYGSSLALSPYNDSYIHHQHQCQRHPSTRRHAQFRHAIHPAINMLTQPTARPATPSTISSSQKLQQWHGPLNSMPSFPHRINRYMRGASQGQNMYPSYLSSHDIRYSYPSRHRPSIFCPPLHPIHPLHITAHLHPGVRSSRSSLTPRSFLFRSLSSSSTTSLGRMAMCRMFAVWALNLQSIIR